ncbi:arginase [soil metagenome]
MANVHILGVPMDLGAGRRGVDMGPSALRLAKLASVLTGLGHNLTDLGNVTLPVPEAVPNTNGLHYLEYIAEACRQTCCTLRDLPTSAFPIVLGGDHSISMGSVAGVAHSSRTGVLWIDAHTDVNTPATSPSGNIHGMPLAHLLGQGDERLLDIWGGGAAVRPEDVVFIGLRSVDEGERDFIRGHGVKAFTMKEIDRRGIAEVAEEALAHLSKVDKLHVSFDADALDPSVAPGVGTPVPGGLT